MIEEIQIIRRTTQQITCVACKGEGLHLDKHVCYICNGKGKVPILVEADVTDLLKRMKRYINKDEFEELFTNKP